MLLEFFTFLCSYFILDMLWIKVSSSYHKGVIEKIQQSPLQVNMVSGTLYYILLSFLMIYALTKFTKTPQEWMTLGFVIALSMFLTYDLTNKTIFTGYPYWYTAMDVIGGVSSIMVALLITLYIKNRK